MTKTTQNLLRKYTISIKLDDGLWTDMSVCPVYNINSKVQYFSYVVCNIWINAITSL